VNRLRTLRARFPQGVAFVFWLIGGTMTLSLFVDLAGENLGRVFLAFLWAAALEAAKIITWLRGWPYRVLSLFLMGLTLVSALSIALKSVESTQDRAAHTQLTQSITYRDQRRLVEGLQAQIDDLVHRISVLPPDYVTATVRLTGELSTLRTQLTEAQKPPINSVAAVEETASFTLLARLLGVDRKALEVVMIMLVAILTEASAVVLAGLPPRDSLPPKGQMENSGPTADDYLRIALDHPGAPRMLGRQVVAKRLGINENQARLLLAQLVREGRIRRSARAFQSIP